MKSPRPFPATLVVVLASLVSAGVMTACAPEQGDLVATAQAVVLVTTPAAGAGVQRVAERAASPRDSI